MSPPDPPRPPTVFTLTADQDPTPELARAHLWAARDRPLREETLCWLAARVPRAAEVRAQVHARARDLGARTDAALWRLGDPAVLEEVEALALALALGDFGRRLARGALEVGSGAATELTRELLESLAALGEAALEGADLRVLAAWWAGGALPRHAACLAVAEEPPALTALLAVARREVLTVAVPLMRASNVVPLLPAAGAAPRTAWCGERDAEALLQGGAMRALFEIEVPAWLLRAPPRSPEERPAGAQVVALHWSLAPIAPGTSARACVGGSGGALALVTLCRGGEDAPAAAMHLVAYAPSAHLDPAGVIEAEAALPPGRYDALTACVTAGGDLLAAPWGRDGLALLALGHAGWETLLTHATEVDRAVLLGSARPLLAWRRRVGFDRERRRVLWEWFGAWPGAPCEVFTFGVLDLLAGWEEPDGTLVFLCREEAGEGLKLVEWRGWVAVATHHVVGSECLTEEETPSVHRLPDGGYLLVWKRARKHHHPDPRGKGGGYVVTVKGVMAAALRDGRLQEPRQILGLDSLSLGEHHEDAAFETAAVSGHLCVLGRSSVTEEFPDEIFKPSIHRASLEIHVFDPDLRPVAGPWRPAVLASRQGSLGAHATLLPRPDGSLGLFVTAGLAPDRR